MCNKNDKSIGANRKREVRYNERSENTGIIRSPQRYKISGSIQDKKANAVHCDGLRRRRGFITKTKKI